MRTWWTWPARSSWRSSAALLLALATSARAEGEVRGKLSGSRALPAVVYASDLPAAVAPPQLHAVLRQLHLRFAPEVLPVVQGTTVDFVNDDSTAHNIFSPTESDAFDLGTFGDGARTHVFQAPGPHVILCNVHLEMVAWVLVLRNAAFAAVDEDGTFLLHLSPGRHRLVLWRPRLEEQSREVEVPAGGDVKLSWDVSGRAR